MYVKIEDLKAAAMKDKELGMVMADAFCEIIDRVPKFSADDIAEERMNERKMGNGADTEYETD